MRSRYNKYYRIGKAFLIGDVLYIKRKTKISFHKKFIITLSSKNDNLLIWKSLLKYTKIKKDIIIFKKVINITNISCFVYNIFIPVPGTFYNTSVLHPIIKLLILWYYY